MSQWQRQTVSAMRDLIEGLSQRDVTTKDGFDREFEALRALDKEVRRNHDEFYSAMLGSNNTKNRFTDVLPNEGTRVTLQPVNSRGDGDYINANYIDARRLFGLPFVYIATQAPMRNTVYDFWRMVFENNSRFIVMLCNEIEAGKIKSERYWPMSIGASFAVGSFTVTLIDENVYEESSFRVVRLANLDGTDARDVYHLQHTKWPDMSVPRTTSAIHDIIAALGQRPESAQYPIVCHCSGGIGRTGVFIAIHIALGLFEKEFPISISGIIQLLKRCRSGMVDRKDQFHFCYFGALREMQRMISRKQRALRGPKEMDRATTRALPFGHSAMDQAGVGPRMSTYRPTHPAQFTPAIATQSSGQPTQMEFDENRHFLFRGADQINHNPYRQASYGRQASLQNTLYGTGASGNFTGAGGDDVDDQLRKVQELNRLKRHSGGMAAGAGGGGGGAGGQQQNITTTLMSGSGGGGGGSGASAAGSPKGAVPMQMALSNPASPQNINKVASPQPQPPSNKFDNL